MNIDDVERLLNDLVMKGYLIEPKSGFIERLE
jgi:hypothetical protein